MKEKINKESIGVIFGGRSVEHDISIITGVQVLNALDRENYNIIPIYISKDNIWYTGESLFDIATFSNFEFESKLKVIDLSYKNKTLYEIKGKKEKRITRLDLIAIDKCGDFDYLLGIKPAFNEYIARKVRRRNKIIYISIEIFSSMILHGFTTDQGSHLRSVITAMVDPLIEVAAQTEIADILPKQEIAFGAHQIKI